MIRSLPAAAFAFCCVVALSSSAPALAQDAAPVATTRCGGVLCDLYYANKPAPAPGQPEAPDPTRLPCRDFVCGMFGGRTSEAPPVAQPVAAPEPAAEPAKKVAHRKHKAAKVAAATKPETGKPEAAQ